MPLLPVLSPSGRLIDLARREIVLLAAVLIAAATLLLFLEVAESVQEGETHAIDRALMLALRDPADPAVPLGPSWLHEVGRDITALGGNAVLTLVTAGSTLYLLLVRKRAAAVLLLVSVLGGMLLSTTLKLGFDRPRPDLVPHGMEVFTASFPSGHALLSAVTYLTLGTLLARLQPRRRLKAFFLGVAVLIAGMVGVSRVYLGVHWPSDVLAGWCIGAAWAMLCWTVALLLQRRGTVEPTPATLPDDSP
ncbi:phosphatase PAP2 family protein [Rhodospirillum centenum]|uniref:PAP2 superfamily n=1 Tax=Rhodospirillum centenum (strain ATCC 51521 / SW) TaxID=414684 RepID=B6IX79_RHOCS|nr:phosphatase PAP2 family protein [Rhodospirillum centenum]ACJ00903.1 PAP2 superfamily [Rhodospirillum centenum SW]